MLTTTLDDDLIANMKGMKNCIKIVQENCGSKLILVKDLFIQNEREVISAISFAYNHCTVIVVTEYCDITCTLLDDILLSNVYGFKMHYGRIISNTENNVLLVQADLLKFVAYKEQILEISCDEFCNW